MPILDEIYDSVVDDDALARLPAALAVELDARSCVLQLFAPDGRPVVHQYSYFSADNFEHYIENALYEFDTWVEIGSRPDLFGTAFNCDDYLAPADYLSSSGYNEIFRRWGDDTGKLLGGCFSIGDHTLTVGLHRSIGGKEFDASQVGQLQGLSGHLRRMFVARRALDRAGAFASEIAAALDAPMIGIVRVDQLGRLVYANAVGQEILHMRDGFIFMGQTITAQDQAVQQRFAKGMRSAASRSGAQGDALLVPRPSGKPPWRVVITPDKAQASGHATLLIESHGSDTDLRAHLGKLYDLTRSESEVAALLADGVPPAEIADQRGVSVETVRNQIKALLQKTGANRLGGLIAILSRTVRTH